MAAGLGYIEFATGDILTAAVANGYLASQTVMVFASASARTTAITSPQEGMISYLKDTNAVEYYSGSAWAAVGGGGGGKVLQVVQGVTTTSTTISTSTLTDTTITASITPTSATSKILVMVDAQAYIYRGAHSTFNGWALLRGATNIYDRSNEGFMCITAVGTSAVELVANSPMTYLDSPATTSSTTYNVQAKSISGGQITFQRNSVPSSITLIEVAP